MQHFGIVWTYQVVEAGFIPEESDELYRFARTRNGVASLAVLRAHGDVSLKDDPEILETDPVVYLVFREDRDRLAGIVSFSNSDGDRVERAWSTSELGRAWSVLSQSQLAGAPTYLAPYSATWGDGERLLENGSTVYTEKMDSGVADIFFDDELSEGMVITRYEFGQPWPTETVSNNMEARLLSAEEVKARSADMRFYMPSPPEDFDYRAALASSIDIDSVLTLDEETMRDGFEASVWEGYRPWAGNWWPTKQGGLVFGYVESLTGQRPTFSDRIQDDIDPLKESMGDLSKALRELDRDDPAESEDYEAKLEEYQATQKELVEKLKEFYGTLLADLDGGRITIADGKASHVDGWSYVLNDLSPMDKYALYQWSEGEGSNNAFYVSAWEILNSYTPNGEGWWGHCNGWAAAAILTNEPREPISVDIRGSSVEFTVADLKGLMTEAHYSTNSLFYGERYNGEEQDISDLTPSAFHKLITYYIRELGVPLVFDTSANEQVWNFPAWSADMDVTEITAEGALDLININTADLETLDALPGVGESRGAAIIDHRELYGPFQKVEDVLDVMGVGEETYEKIKDLVTVKPPERTFAVTADIKLTTDSVGVGHVDAEGEEPQSMTKTWRYTLVTDVDGVVLDGTWDDNSSHPDFAWVPYDNPLGASSGRSENPFLVYGDLLDIMGDDFRRE